jgi:hypothetical protein
MKLVRISSLVGCFDADEVKHVRQVRVREENWYE